MHGVVRASPYDVSEPLVSASEVALLRSLNLLNFTLVSRLMGPGFVVNESVGVSSVDICCGDSEDLS